MPTFASFGLPLALALSAPAAFSSQTGGVALSSPLPAEPYAAIADRVLGAPAIIDATIRDAVRLKPAESVGVRPGHARFYVTADVVGLIRGVGGIAPRISYLADVPFDSRGRSPRLKKLRVLLFARPVPGRPGEVQLTAPDHQRDWTPEQDAAVRSIVREVVAPDAPPAITGIGNAFHVPGSLPGEGETQIFLNTADKRPVSLAILRRPGEQPRWAVSLSEIVDEAATAPARDTLLWYRLACSLPPALPDRSVAAMEPTDAAVAREDYGFVLRSLGTCQR